jgi:hypothetical protein
MRMTLRQRLAAGVRALSDGWARDLCVLYGIDPGEELKIAVRRPATDPDTVEVWVAPRLGHSAVRVRP